ncbi:unnamed protein product [Sphagnum tenellum]
MESQDLLASSQVTDQALIATQLPFTRLAPKPPPEVKVDQLVVFCTAGFEERFAYKPFSLANRANVGDGSRLQSGQGAGQKQRMTPVPDSSGRGGLQVRQRGERYVRMGRQAEVFRALITPELLRVHKVDVEACCVQPLNAEFLDGTANQLKTEDDAIKRYSHFVERVQHFIRRGKEKSGCQRYQERKGLQEDLQETDVS